MPLRIVTWNVNGLRAISSKFGGVRRVLEALERCDVVCLQETKLTRSELDHDLAVVPDWESYFAFSRSRSGYSGVATFCRRGATVPSAAAGGFAGWQDCDDLDDLLPGELDALDSEGRCVMTDHGQFVLLNIYAPAITSTENMEQRMEFKVQWYEALHQRAASLVQHGRNVVIVGDFNVSLHPEDTVHRSEDGNSLRTRPDRRKLFRFLKSGGDGTSSDTGSGTGGGTFVDVFRRLHPSRKDAYTCWCTMTGARANNYGSRIDMILAAQGVGEASFIERLVHCDIWPEMEGSDHAPVFVDMELLQPLSCRLTIPPPAVSSRALFAAKQRQLDSWLGACNVQKGAAQRQAEDSRVCAAPRRDKPAGATVDGRDCQDMIGCNDACGRGQGSGKSEAAVKRTMGHSILGTAVPAKKRREQRDVREFFNAKPLVKEGTPRITSTGKDRLPKPSDDAKEQPGLQNKGTELQKGTSAKAASPSHCPAHLRGSPVRDSSNLPEEWIKRAESVAAWERINRMLQPPRCQGHGEPCVIREVKKQCANKGRLFFVCARPEGHRPKGRCNHFEWAAKRSYRG